MDRSCVLAAQNISAVLKTRGLSTGFLVGRLADGLAATLAQKLDASEESAAFRYAGDVLSDPDAVHRLENGNGTLVLVRRYETSCGEIERTVTLLKALGKNVLGFMMVE